MKRYTLAAVLLLLVAVTGCQARSRHNRGGQINEGKKEDPRTVTIRVTDRDHRPGTDHGIPPMPDLPDYEPPKETTPPIEVVIRPTKPLPRLEPLRISKAGWAPKGKRKWKYIVIHHSATASGNAARFHRNHRDKRGWVNGLGYDFVIGNGHGSGDGQVEVGPRWRRQIDGAHAGNAKYNKNGIGICLVGNFDESEPSDRQLRALAELVHFMQKRYGIRDARIKLHQQIRQGSTHCPGKNFDMKQFLRILRARRSSD